MKHILIAVLLLASISTAVCAQRWEAFAMYDMAFPASDTKDFAGDVSYRGGGITAVRYMLLPGLAIGVSWQWSTFQEKTRDLIELDGISISGDQVRRIYMSPVLLNAFYYYAGPEDTWKVRPFAGTGIGAYYIQKNLEFGLTNFEEKNWHFGIAPRAGVVFPLYQTSIEGTVDFSYHYIFEAGNGTAHSFYGIQVGFGYRR
jgi:hypothetical protein